jgi:thermostable 8-oxoguanine DNA glycosylase
MEHNLNSKEMAKFIFIIEEDQNREASKIEFEVPNDMDVWEYKRMCIRMAGAMGYASLSVKKAFGQEYLRNVEEELNEIFKNAYSGSLV